MNKHLRNFLTTLIWGVVAGAPLLYSGVFYTTGRQWHDSCTDYRDEQEKVNWGTPPTVDSFREEAWHQCEKHSLRGLYEAGLILADHPRDAHDQVSLALAKACPRSWVDVSPVGTYVVTLQLNDADGGVHFQDNFLPAEFMIGRLWKKAWPTCVARRTELGYPQIIENGEGIFEWKDYCRPCAAH